MMKQTVLTGVLHFLYRKRYLVIILIISFIGFMVFQMSSLSVDNSFDVWFVEDDPALSSYRTFRKTFGSDEVVVTTITDSVSVFSCIRLKQISALTDSIASINGVSKVMSVNNFYIPSFDSTGIVLERPARIACDDIRNPDLPEIFQKMKNTHQFVSPDQRTTAVFTWLDTLEDIDIQRKPILEKINRFAEQSVGNRIESINHGGFGVVFNALNEATINDGLQFILLSYVIIIVSLLLVTRSVLWTVIAILSVTLANITVFGLMGLFDRPVTMVTMALPPLIMVLGIANVLHISVHTNRRDNVKQPDTDHLIFSLTLIVLPCLFNAMTTAGGFFSLGVARMAVTRDYGIFAAAGVLSALAFSIIGTISFLKYILKRTDGTFTSYSMIQKATTSIMLWAVFHRKIICTGFFVLIILSLYAAYNLVIDTYSINFLPQNHRVVEDSRLIEKKIGNYLPLEFIITPQDTVTWNSPQLLKVLGNVQKKIENMDQIDATLSIADIQNQISGLSMSASLMGFSSRHVDIFRDSLEEQGIFRNLVDINSHSIRLTAWVSMASAKQLTAIADSVIHVAQPILGSAAIINTSGYLPLYSRIVSNVMNDQIISFSIAMVVIFILIGLILRSIRMVLVALPSNLIPVLLIFAFMGIMGINLDIATVTVAAAVLGIIVDDTVHILYNLRQQLNRGLSFEAAISNVAEQTGVAVVSTSIILILGFTVIAFSGIKSVSYTGLLTTLAVIAALLADFFLLPGLASFVFSHPKKT